MGPSCRQQSSSRFSQSLFLVTLLVCGLVVVVAPLMAQTDSHDSASTLGAADSQQTRSTEVAATAGAPSPDSPSLGNVSGTVLDATGAPVAGARVRLSQGTSAGAAETVTAQDGQFTLANITPGRFELSITLAGFKAKTVSGNLPPKEDYVVPGIGLELAAVVTDVSVKPQEEIAEEQIKAQEQQRLIGVIPNFYASYVPDAAPLNTRQKYQLAWKLAIDPTSFLIAGIIAGGQQANNSLAGYGQGAAGYFNRLGAAYGDFFIGTYLGNAVFCSILKQDPRYFYKGTGSKKSRIWYAIYMSVMAKGDNGNWQPNYSGILGSLAAGGMSNLYYPAGSRNGFETTVNNTLIGIATGAGVNILQEFVFRRVTPKVPQTQPKD
ncbi:MAG TPA: carboxypeptidase-like regulatory domain-containing protein [Candidatus Angelobacter sp.]|nr:carboxypeptidase-like regulatory domain-containing protein [Candidatus Angelobacter sp.]